MNKLPLPLCGLYNVLRNVLTIHFKMLSVLIKFRKQNLTMLYGLPRRFPSHGLLGAASGNNTVSIKSHIIRSHTVSSVAKKREKVGEISPH